MFGWSLPFEQGLLDEEIERLAFAAGFLVDREGLVASPVRVSTLHDRLFLHSAYPTVDEDAVFFGPDSYRFADLVVRELARRPAGPAARIIDIGTGAGVGAIVAGSRSPGASIRMTDINPKALALARVNAAHAGIMAEAIETDGLAGVAGSFDLALANPPYIIDDHGRAYRDGGDMHGGRISLDMARAAMAQLAPQGRLILYTGSAIISGHDPLRDALEDVARELRCSLRYREIDPDVFGEELEKAAYRDVDRIAVVAAIFSRRT